MATEGEYDPRYLAGIEHFNREEYFDAHEVWEDLWNDCAAEDRRFFQSLIQAAVALYHWSRGNAVGANRLFESGRRYMEPYSPRSHGLDVADFWTSVEARMNAGSPSPRIVLKGSP